MTSVTPCAPQHRVPGGSTAFSGAWNRDCAASAVAELSCSCTVTCTITRDEVADEEQQDRHHQRGLEDRLSVVAAPPAARHGAKRSVCVVAEMSVGSSNPPAPGTEAGRHERRDETDDPHGDHRRVGAAGRVRRRDARAAGSCTPAGRFADADHHHPRTFLRLHLGRGGRAALRADPARTSPLASVAHQLVIAGAEQRARAAARRSRRSPRGHRVRSPTAGSSRPTTAIIAACSTADTSADVCTAQSPASSAPIRQNRKSGRTTANSTIACPTPGARRASRTHHSLEFPSHRLAIVAGRGCLRGKHHERQVDRDERVHLHRVGGLIGARVDQRASSCRRRTPRGRTVRRPARR